jgi:hypothetical protein
MHGARLSGPERGAAYARSPQPLGVLDRGEMPQCRCGPSHRRVPIDVAAVARHLLRPFGVGAHPLTSPDRGEAPVLIASRRAGSALSGSTRLISFGNTQPFLSQKSPMRGEQPAIRHCRATHRTRAHEIRATSRKSLRAVSAERQFLAF